MVFDRLRKCGEDQVAHVVAIIGNLFQKDGPITAHPIWWTVEFRTRALDDQVISHLYNTVKPLK